jgi:hypothetical protein
MLPVAFIVVQDFSIVLPWPDLFSFLVKPPTLGSLSGCLLGAE